MTVHTQEKLHSTRLRQITLTYISCYSYLKLLTSVFNIITAGFILILQCGVTVSAFRRTTFDIVLATCNNKYVSRLLTCFHCLAVCSVK